MMINKKNCILIVLLVLVALPKSSKSIFSRFTKRSTDDGACEQSTASLCTKIINEENGLLQRFSSDTSQHIQNHYKNATAKCKVLLCVMTMYAVTSASEKYYPIPNSPFIDDEAFVSVIKRSGLIECSSSNKDSKNYNNIDADGRKEGIYTSTIDDESYTTDTGSGYNVNNFETTSTQQDTQSIKSNGIDGSLSESKHERRKGIIDILYTNENYTKAAKSEHVSEQTATEFFENNPWTETISVGTTLEDSASQFIFESGEDERSELDVANRIGGAGTMGNEESNDSTSDFDFVSSFITTTSTTPVDSTNANTEVLATTSGTYWTNNGGLINDETDKSNRIVTLESSAIPSTNQSSLTQVGNLIFQLLGEEGYDSFSCNLTTADEDGTTSDSKGNIMYRRTNKKIQSSATKGKTELIDSNALPEIPSRLHDDQQIKKLLLKFNILELCNFTCIHQANLTENDYKKLILCSNEISKLDSKVDGKTGKILQKYSQDIRKAVKKYTVTQAAQMKIIKIINLTDYLSSTIKDTDIPKELKSNFLELKQFLLVELKNEDLFSFHPDTNRKGIFMVQLFDYLIQSKIVDNKKRKLLGIFKKFIRNVT